MLYPSTGTSNKYNHKSKPQDHNIILYSCQYCMDVYVYQKKELQLSYFSICEGKKLDDKIVT